MEDIKKRLTFQNSGLQIQTIWRLCEEIHKKKPEGYPITEGSPEILELGTLQDGLCGPDALVARTCGEALLHLVQAGALHYGRALDLLLAATPSLRFLSPTVRVLQELMTMEALAALSSTGSYRSPYGLRSRPHPMISVLSHRPDAWPCVTEQVAATFRHADPRVRSVAVELVRPVLAFLLAEPQTSETHSQARRALVRVLVAQLRADPRDVREVKGGRAEVVAREVVQVMLKLLSQSPVRTQDQLIFLSDVLEDLSRALRHHCPATSPGAPSRRDSRSDADDGSPTPEHDVTQWLTFAGMTFTLGLEVVLECSRADLGFSSIALELAALAETCSLSAMYHTDLNLVFLAEVLDTPLAHHAPEILTLVKAALCACPPSANTLCVTSLLKPLLQILAVPGGAVKGQGRVRSLASECLSLVQDMISPGMLQHTQVSPLPELYLTLRGHKCRLVRDLCLTLTGNSINNSNDDDDDGRYKPSAPEGSGHDNVQEIEARLAAWAENAAACLDMRRGRAAASDAGSTSRVARLACGVLVSASSLVVTRAGAGLVAAVAGVEPTQALDLLPVILYVLGRNPCPESRLELLQILPDLATHKLCVSPILKLVLAMAQSPPTRALAVAMTTRLWRRQDRCFPQLQRLLVEKGPQGAGQESRDVLLAKAAAILEICKSKPEKYGAELLTPLSHILEVSQGQGGVAASVLLLDGLYLLCQAEVLDLVSLWAVLGPRLSREVEKRPLVAARVCRLLSLVPELTVDTEEYQTFSNQAALTLWQYVQDNPTVRCAALQALAGFSPGQFKPSYLPEEVTRELRNQAELAADQARAEREEESSPEIEVTMDELFPHVPAWCYTALLKTTNICGGATKGLATFLQAQATREVSQLPRGVYFSSSVRQQARGGAALDAVPGLLRQLHERTRQAELRPALAAGLLFCFNPPVETGRDGRQFVTRHSQTFLQMFASLLQEVPAGSSDWHLCSLLPSAWCTFMQRLFTAVLEGRRAQLDYQDRQGKSPATADAATERGLAWLWARDSIVEGIRAASMGGPQAQANSVLSLAGLTLCVHHYASDLDPAALEVAEEGRSMVIGHSRWVSMACDTALSLADVEYKPRVGLLGLCQQRSTLDRSPPSLACSLAARAASSQLVPIFMAAQKTRGGMDTILRLLEDFSANLAKSPSSSSFPASDRGGKGRGAAGGTGSGKGNNSQSQLDVWSGLSLGILLARLFEEHFSQTTGSKGMLAVWKALTALENACLASMTTATATRDVPTDLHGSAPTDASTDAPVAAPEGTVSSRTGVVLGLGQALCGLCAEGKAESRVHVTATLGKMQAMMETAAVEDPVYEILCLAVSRVAATLLVSNASVQDVVTPLLTRVTKLHIDHPEKRGVAISLGLLASTLTKLGSSEASHQLTTIQESWQMDILCEDTPVLFKVSKLSGLMAALGCEQGFITGSSALSSTGDSRSEITSSISKMVTGDLDPNIQKVAPWLLGHLHFSVTSDPGNKSSVPSSYSYLPESSFLRALVDFLFEAARAGLSSRQILPALGALRTERSLPPLDWAALLSPFMRVNNSEDVRTLCLQVATAQMPGSSSAASFVSSWLTPPLFNSLALSSQAALHRCLSQVIKSVSPSILKIYLDRSCTPAFTDLASNLSAILANSGPTGAGDELPGATRLASYDVVMSILAGLRDALAVEDPPQSVTMLLYEATASFYQLIPVSASEATSKLYMDLLRAMAECFAQVPDDILDSILAADFMDVSTQLKGSFMRCHLVANGRQPVSLLNVVVDAAFNLAQWNHKMGMSLLAHCLAVAPGKAPGEGGASEQPARLQWLSEMLGHTGTIATGAWPLADTAPPLAQVIQNLLDVVTCACLMITSPCGSDLALWGLDPTIFTDVTQRKNDADDRAESEVTLLKPDRSQRPQLLPDTLMGELRKNLPSAVQVMTREAWAVLMPKVLDWMLTIVYLDNTGQKSKDVLYAALMSLRHVQEFTPASVWTKAVRI